MRTCILAALLLAMACTPPKAATTALQRVPARFDFAPPSRMPAGAAGLTVALIRPRFVGENPEYYVAPFADMAASMAQDFEELLTAKGFRIRGPFGTRDEMVYGDKTASDFAVEVAIDLRPQYNRRYRFDPGLGVLRAAHYKMSGEIVLSGNLVITAASPQYGEKIWKKNIALQPSTFTYTGSLKWNEVPSLAEELRQDNAVYNNLARELETYYQSALALAWQQIEAAEMKTVAAEARKADKKGG